MKRIFIMGLLTLLTLSKLMATGEPSTYFNIYVPPNNDAVRRNVAIIVTAIQDSTSFSITDDDADGDSDDSFSGILMAGQSYILYIKDNGINDDARYASGGELKRDGDYFIIESNKLVYASMSTDSDWQHDFVPSVNKKSIGEKFLIYSPKTSYSPRDLNVFAYEENTTITISRISLSATKKTGYTHVDINQKEIVVQKTIQPGQDIIHYFQEGRDIMASGETFIVESNKPVSVQYGALWRNAHDGGAYVPSSNGSSSGELFYFAVPKGGNGMQEIRIVSWDDDNSVTLERYNNGNWISMNNWSIDALKTADWVGRENGNQTHETVFRVSCSAGKRVSVFEANWLETGSIGTSDIATMLSSANGTASGKTFLGYMAPPGHEHNVVNPFTGEFFGGSYSHFFLFANTQAATVTVKDAKTNGQVIHKTFEIEAGRYADAYFSTNEWKSIYNGTGKADGPDRPYVIIESDQNISVLATNFNDNWMTYFGSSLPQSFNQQGNTSQGSVIPGDTLIVSSEIVLETDSIENPSVTVNIGSGLVPIESHLVNNTNNQNIDGNITYEENGSSIHFENVPNITSEDDFEVETTLLVTSSQNNGNPLPPGTVLTVETIVSGTINGQLQESILSQGVQTNSDITSQLLFSNCGAGSLIQDATDSWNAAWIDYDNDGDEDIFMTDKGESQACYLFQNDGLGNFTKRSNSSLLAQLAKTVSSTWADIDNDGLLDVFVVNATGKKSMLYHNEGNGEFTALENSGIYEHPEYFHGAAWADFDKDGYVDLLVTNFFSTRFHHLYKNNGDNTFTLVTNTPITTVAERAMAPILSDYDQDGFVDIFIPNGNNRPNHLFRNLGAFQFEPITEGEIVTDAKNTVAATWGDMNNDGYPDLFVANASGKNNDLYRNNGDGTFTKLTESLVSQEGGHSHGAAWVDVENDADLDLLVTNDQGPNFLYINDGAGNFTRKQDENLSAYLGKAYGNTWADYNRDGFMDVLVTTHSGDLNRLFCNNGNSNNWLSLKLVGNNSNRCALGTRVKIKTNGVWQMREVLPVTGLGSQQSMRVHFGLGAATQIDSLVIFWASGYQQVLTENLEVNRFQTILEEDAKLIQGITFHDRNANGQKEEGEENIGNIKLTLDPNDQFMSSDAEGTFETRVSAGNYQLEVYQSEYWSVGNMSAIDLSTQESIQVEVPLVTQTLGYDLALDVSTTAWRRGFGNETIVQVSNLGTEAVSNVEVNLTYPEQVVIQNSDVSYSQSNQTYTWTIASLKAGEIVSIQVEDSVTLEATTGEFLSLQGEVSASGTDLNENNNTYEEQIEIVGAIDPNDILASPRGEGAAHFIAQEQELTYTVRFQNVGTYAATYVFIENQLPTELDIATFEVVASSHEYHYELSEDGLLKVSYLYINLPDSLTNEAESHGYFKYKIKPKAEVMGGEVITNQAEITFDFEVPVVTNEVFHTIRFDGDGEKRELLIFPNPASEKTQISINPEYNRFDNLPKFQSYGIRDSQGRLLKSAEGFDAHQMEIDLLGLPSGVYILEAFDNQNNSYYGRLLIKE